MSRQYQREREVFLMSCLYPSFLFSYADFNVRIFHDQSNDFFIHDENN